MAKIIIHIPNNKVDDVAADFAATHERREDETTDLAFVARVITDEVKRFRRQAWKVRLEALAASDTTIDDDMTGGNEG